MAARTGRENTISEAVVRRLAAAAPTRLSGERPGILAVFLDEVERAEWRGLREAAGAGGGGAPLPDRPGSAAGGGRNLHQPYGIVRPCPAGCRAGGRTALPQPDAPAGAAGGSASRPSRRRCRQAQRLPPPRRPDIAGRHPPKARLAVAKASVWARGAPADRHGPAADSLWPCQGAGRPPVVQPPPTCQHAAAGEHRPAAPAAFPASAGVGRLTPGSPPPPPPAARRTTPPGFRGTPPQGRPSLGAWPRTPRAHGPPPPPCRADARACAARPEAAKDGSLRYGRLAGP